MTYKVHPAADLFPMLPDEELRNLAEDIKANGLIEPVWLYEDPGLGTVLLDGRNRLSACEIAGVEPRTRVYKGGDPIAFAISVNVKRRHLTVGQKAGIAHRSIPLYEEEARAFQRARLSAESRAGGGKLTSEASGTNRSPMYPVGKSADRAARSVGIGAMTVKRYKRVAERAPELAEKIDSGDITPNRAERILRDREAERRRVEQSHKDAALSGLATTVDIRQGNFREVLADLSDVDAIITDPPYPREFVPLLGDLAEWADKVLKPDGVLAVLFGQTYLPEVYRLLDGYRPYRWTACYLTPKHSYASHARKVDSNWKPLIVYGGTKRFKDVIRCEDSDEGAKDHHKWGQDYSAFHKIIDKLTVRGETVVDPFMGSGTTLLAAHALGRHAIGCDVDPEPVETARSRLGVMEKEEAA